MNGISGISGSGCFGADRDCTKKAVARVCSRLIGRVVGEALSCCVDPLYIPLSQPLHDGAGYGFVGPILRCNPYPGSNSSWCRLRAGFRSRPSVYCPFFNTGRLFSSGSSYFRLHDLRGCSAFHFSMATFMASTAICQVTFLPSTFVVSPAVIS